MKYTPRRITQLEPNQIFVFGSNTEGIHGAGAAAMALNFGAIWGQASGRQGQTYAIITKDLKLGQRSIPVDVVQDYIKEFIDYALEFPDLEFLVTEIGCGLAGYRIAEMATPFYAAFGDDLSRLPAHIVLSKSFYQA